LGLRFLGWLGQLRESSPNSNPLEAQLLNPNWDGCYFKYLG